MHSLQCLATVQGATHPSSNTSPHILLEKHTNEYLLSKFAWFARDEKQRESRPCLNATKGKRKRKKLTSHAVLQSAQRQKKLESLHF
jgi:hypothetical protein